MPVISREWEWAEGVEDWESIVSIPGRMTWTWAEGDLGPPPNGVVVLSATGQNCQSWWILRDITWGDILPTIPEGSKIKAVRLASCKVFHEGTWPAWAFPSYNAGNVQIVCKDDGMAIWTAGEQLLMQWNPLRPEHVGEPYCELAAGSEWLPVHPDYSALDTNIYMYIYVIAAGRIPGYTITWDNFKLDVIYEEGDVPDGDGPPDDEDTDVDDDPPYDTSELEWPTDDLVYDCDEPGYNEGAIVHHTLGQARLWSSEQRLYVSYGGRTLVYDTVTRSWTDAGYGRVKAALNVMDGRHPESMWMLLRSGGPAEQPTEANLPSEYENAIWVAHRALTNNDPMTGALYARRAVLGPYDGNRDARGRNKRAIRLRVWGSVTDVGINQSVQSVGTLTFKNESGYSETYPIIPRQFNDGGKPDTPSTIVDQMFTPAMIGRVLFADMTFTAKCVAITESELEYVVLS